MEENNILATKTIDVKRAKEKKDRENKFILWYINIHSLYGEGNVQILDQLEISKNKIN